MLRNNVTDHYRDTPERREIVYLLISELRLRQVITDKRINKHFDRFVTVEK